MRGRWFSDVTRGEGFMRGRWFSDVTRGEGFIGTESYASDGGYLSTCRSMSGVRRGRDNMALI